MKKFFKFAVDIFETIVTVAIYAIVVTVVLSAVAAFYLAIPSIILWLFYKTEDTVMKTNLLSTFIVVSGFIVLLFNTQLCRKIIEHGRDIRKYLMLSNIAIAIISLIALINIII